MSFFALWCIFLKLMGDRLTDLKSTDDERVCYELVLCSCFIFQLFISSEDSMFIESEGMVGLTYLHPIQHCAPLFLPFN